MKAWISPAVVIAFLVISVTGILMFFHVKNGIIVDLHEWLGWIFVVVGVFHLIINWKLFTCLFKKKTALASLALVSAVTLIIALSSENNPGDRKRRGHYHSEVIEMNTDTVLEVSQKK